MSQIKIPVFSLCPFRSPVEIPEETHVLRPEGLQAQKPREALGNCFGPGCGLWCVTRIEAGQPVDGACAVKIIAGTLNAIANRYVAPAAGEKTN